MFRYDLFTIFIFYSNMNFSFSRYDMFIILMYHFSGTQKVPPPCYFSIVICFLRTLPNSSAIRIITSFMFTTPFCWDGVFEQIPLKTAYALLGMTVDVINHTPVSEFYSLADIGKDHAHDLGRESKSLDMVICRRHCICVSIVDRP